MDVIVIQGIGRWGEQYLWHLPKSAQLIAYWKATAAGQEPRDLEQQMIEQFLEWRGVIPFASLVRQRRNAPILGLGERYGLANSEDTIDLTE